MDVPLLNQRSIGNGDNAKTIPPEAIEKTKVKVTIFDGKVIYQR